MMGNLATKNKRGYTLNGAISLLEKGLITPYRFSQIYDLIRGELDGVESVDIEYDADEESYWVNVVYY